MHPRRYVSLETPLRPNVCTFFRLTTRWVVCVLLIALSPALAAIPEYEFVDIAALAGRNVLPLGISNDGTIVGAAGEQGFVLRNGNLTYVELPGLGVNLTGINPSGTACVGIYWDPADRPLGFVYSLVDGSFRFLPDVGGASFSTYTTGINDAGMVVGDYQTRSTGIAGKGFVIEGETVRTYGAPGAVRTSFGGVNNAGQIVGYWNAGGAEAEDHPFLLEGDRLSSLPLSFQSSSTQVTDINNRGQIVGWQVVTGITYHGFLLDGEDETLIRHPGGDTRIYGINDAGVIVGYRYDPGPRGFIAYPKTVIPEPSSLALLLAGAPLAGVRRRR